MTRRFATVILLASVSFVGCGSIPENDEFPAQQRLGLLAQPEQGKTVPRVAAQTTLTSTSGAKTTSIITEAQQVTEAQGAIAVPAAGTYEGCPYGAVCIYPEGTGYNSGIPSLIFWSYGYHNLSDQYGIHRILNNQSGGATMRTCTGYNGTRCQGLLGGFQYMDKDMTPINSITLEK